MTINRRNILSGAALATALAAANAARAEEPPAPAAPAKPKPTLDERLAKAAMENRYRVVRDGLAFSGPGWDRLVEEGRKAQFFLMGEEHGVAEVPMVAGALMTALKPAGYQHLAIEISPPIAADMDRAAGIGVDGLKRYYAEHPPGPAFYTWREETEMLARVRALHPANRQMLWGMDYEVLQDRRLIGMLAKAAPASARAPLAALKTACDAAWAKYESGRNIGDVFSFSGDPALVAAVRAAWPKPDPASDWVLTTLQSTLEINRFQVTERYHQANQTRADLNRANFVRYWNGATSKGAAPKVMFKMGGNHMMRGRSMTECYDLGNMVAECAALRGGSSFHLLVGPGAGTKQSALNPETMKSMPVPAETWAEMGVAALAGAAVPDSPTLIDLRPMRDWLPGKADPNVARVVRGFDAILVLSGSTPAADY